MPKKWIIHSDNKSLGGPWQASELRDMLRKGLIDPFVVVSSASTPMERSELIEIDEIFAVGTSQEIQTEVVAPRELAPKKQAQPIAPVIRIFQNQSEKPSQQATVISNKNNGHVQQVQLSDQGSFLGLADPNSEVVGESSQSRERKEKAKKFYLIDERQAKSEGMSAQEILELHLAKRLNSRFKVGKIGASGAISISKFIRTYSKTIDKGQKQEVPRLLGDRQAADPIRARTGPSPHSSISSALPKAGNKGLAGLFVALLLGAAFGLYYMLSENPIDFQGNPNKTQSVRSSKQQKNRQTGQDRPKISPSVNLLDRSNLRRSAQGNRENRRNRPFPSNAPNINSAPTVKGGIINNIPDLARANNRIVNVGPLSFSTRELSSCPLKCTLTMRDSKNRMVSVSFFKGAFINDLENKSQGVYVRGTVKGRGATLYLAEVY